MRVKATMEIWTKAVVFYEEGIRSAKERGETYNLSERTVRRWAKAHSLDKENRILTWNKRGAGHGAGASTAKLCEACDVGGDQQADKIQLRQDFFADMKIGRSCSSPRAFRPFRSHHLPCIPGVALLRCSTPTARRVALSPSAALARSSHHASHRVRRC